MKNYKKLIKHIFDFVDVQTTSSIVTVILAAIFIDLQ